MDTIKKEWEALAKEIERYELRTDTLTDEDGIEHFVYGISAVGSDGSALMTVPNVFYDLAAAMDFVDMCNSAKLSPIHLMDVIDDVLSDLS